MGFASVADRDAIENEMTWEERGLPQTTWALLSRTAAAHGPRPAVTFQMFSDPGAPAETLTWAQLQREVARTANLFRSLGIGEGDVVAYLLPNCTETVLSYIGGQVAGIVNPINPLLDAENIAAILRETGAKVLVTLRAFPKTDVAEKAARAVELAPSVEHVVEVDLLRYLTGAKRLIVPLIRPRPKVAHKAKVHDFRKAIAAQPATLSFPDGAGDRVAACFHTGGTTGLPKVAQLRYGGIVYNAWIVNRVLLDEQSVAMCPLPMFHVFAAVIIVGGALSSGAHIVFPTPQGYRGDGVFKNFWKLCERYRVTFIIGVPTAIAVLMQRKVDADLSSLKLAFSGSAPLPVELYKRFEQAAGIKICEAYGLTEATCGVSTNPPDGVKKIGSVGIPLPYTSVKIFCATPDGVRECAIDEVGEICVSNPGVWPGMTYTDASKNADLFHPEPGGNAPKYLRTGDLGRLDADGYLWITGRAKDLIIRGGHNIDPAVIEDALSGHDQVAFVGAIGQPDTRSGELPCAYVELVADGKVTEAELLDFARARIHERAAQPKYLEILPELPKTAVGKIFKPDLRKRAIARVFDAVLAEAGTGARVSEVYEDRKRGLVARIRRPGEAEEAVVSRALGGFTLPWEWAD